MVKLFSTKEIFYAADLLQREEVIAFPTETVYGLGALLSSEKAVKSIFSIKKRPLSKGLIAHIYSIEQAHQITDFLPPDFFILARAFFPGPLTLVLPKAPSISSLVTGGEKTIALRMPSHPVARSLLEAVGSPLVGTSANLSGEPHLKNSQDIIKAFQKQIAGVLEGGESSLFPSTVVSLVGQQPQLLRLGALSQTSIEKVLKKPLC